MIQLTIIYVMINLIDLIYIERNLLSADECDTIINENVNSKTYRENSLNNKLIHDYSGGMVCDVNPYEKSIDILNKGRIPNQIKKSKEAFEKSKELARVKAQEKLATMPGVNTSLKVPPGMTKEQFYLVQAIANAKTPKDYSRIKKELGLGLMPRASKPFIRQEEAGGNNE